MKARLLFVFALTLVASIRMVAQSGGRTCSQTEYTNKLICTLPQLFTPIGLTLPNPTHNAHFADASETLLALPVNQGIGQALAILPLGSSGSGITWTPNAEGHNIPTEDSLGPIIIERANVLGKRNAVNLGVAYQHFNFSHLDGIRLSSFPVVLTHEDWKPSLDQGTIADPIYKQDYITTQNQVHLELNQTVIYAVYGVSSRIDASIEVPIQAAHFHVISTANIVRTQVCEADATCSKIVLDPTTHEPVIDPITGLPLNLAKCGEFHYFAGYSQGTSGNQVTEQENCSLILSLTKFIFPSTNYNFQLLQTYDDNGNPQQPKVVPVRSSLPPTDATGIGDITLRGKYEVYHGEKIVASIGLAVRFPSGDAKNFLGTGAYGFIPFGALTYRSRLSPHVRFGYEWNSHSILAGDPSGIAVNSAGQPIIGATASLPAAWLYSGGADYRATKRLTLAADLIGQRVLDVGRLTFSHYDLLPPTDGTTNPHDEKKGPVPSIQPVLNSTGSAPARPGYNSDSIAVGAKARLYRQLVLEGNVTMRVNDGGLRADVVPLIGLSYAF